MIEFEIDNKKVSVKKGGMIIEAADAAGIYIPRFCYHKKLSIAANCRMCLVEVEKSAKALPACATPAVEGMKVFTKSQAAVEAQRSVMEFLLINHPLDCPICDQGGECELQDLSLGYGNDISRYYEGKRSVVDEDLGPLISTDMTRCIQCTRCVRFGTEIAGLRELGTTNRGENLEISTYINKTLRSELSGNIIDLCPVGALTSKPFRFTARAWELKQHPTVAPHDCIGSNIFAHSRGYEYNDYRLVMRVVPRENEQVNETWISDRDRYSYEALKSADRLLTPKIKRESEWVDVDWNTALNFVVEKWHKILNQSGPDAIGALASPSSTCEEFYLLQKLFRALGSNNVDHRIRQLDFSQQENLPLYPHMELDLSELEKQDTIFLIGSDIRQEQPMGGHRIRKASLNGAHIFCLNPVDYDVNYDLASKMIVPSHLIPNVLAGIAAALLPDEPALATIKPTKEENAFAKQLKKKGKGVLLLGISALSHVNATLIRALSEKIAAKLGFSIGYLTEGANAAGAWLSGMVPHRGPGGMLAEQIGKHTLDMFSHELKSYLLVNIEPEIDCIKSAQALNALMKAEFVVVMTPFVSEMQEQYADVLLPIAPFFENPGTFININSQWQTFSAVTRPLGEAKPAWKILRVLGNLFHIEGFDYVKMSQVTEELKNLIEIVPKNFPNLKIISIEPAEELEDTVRQLTEWPIYHIDNFVRRAAALQQWSLEENLVSARISAAVAKKYHIQSGEVIAIISEEQQLELPVVVDPRIAGEYVLVPSGNLATAGFGAHMGQIKILRGQY